MSLIEKIKELSQKKIAEIIDKELGGVCLYEITDKVRVLYYNDGFQKISGYTREQYSKYENDALKPLNTNDAMKIMQFARQSMRTRAPFQTIYRIKGQDGKIRWHDLKAIPINSTEDSNGKIFLSFMHDISNVKETENLLDSILNSSSSSIFRSYLKNGKNTLIYANDNFFKLRQCTPKELREDYNNDSGNFIFEEDKEKVSNVIENAIKERQKSFAVSMRIRNNLGDVIWLRSNGSITYDVDGGVLITGVDYDITEQVQMQESIAKKNEELYKTSTKLKSIVDNIPGGVFTLEVGDKFEAFGGTEGLFRILGITKEQYYENPDPFRFIPEEYEEKLRKAFIEAGQNKKDVELVFPIINTGSSEKEEKWVLGKGRVVNSDGKKYTFYIVLSDITEQMKASKILKLSEERLKIAFKQTGLVIREYDYATKELKQVSSDEHNGYIERNIPETFIEENIIHQISHKDYLEVFRKLRNGEKFASAIIRARNRWDDEYGWYKIRYTNVFDENHRPYKAIETIEDVNESKLAFDKYQDANKYKDLIIADAVHSFTCDLTYNKVLTVTPGLLKQLNIAENISYPEFIEAYAKNIVQVEWHKDFFDLVNRKNLARAYNNDERLQNIEFQSFDETGEIIWYNLCISLIKSSGTGNICALFYAKDISDLKEHELSLKNLVERDPLTYFYNRETYINMVETIMDEQKDKNIRSALVVVEFDGFKELNDKYGHAFADANIKTISEKIMMFCSGDDIIGRIAGNRMSIFIKNCYTEVNVLKRMTNISYEIKKTLDKTEKTYRVGYSIGVAFTPDNAKDFQTLLGCAEAAVIQAKIQGEGMVSVYGNERGIRVVPEMRQERMIDELDELVYIVSMRTHNLLFINRKVQETFNLVGKNYKGLKCYELLYNGQSVCDFCPKGDMTSDRFCAYEKTNPINGKYYIYKAKIISWNGVPAVLVIALDITAKEFINKDLEERVAVGDAVTECIKKAAITSDWHKGAGILLDGALDYYDAEQACITIYNRKLSARKVLLERKSIRAEYKEGIHWLDALKELRRDLREIISKNETFVYLGNNRFNENPALSSKLEMLNVDNACVFPFRIDEEWEGTVSIVNTHKTFSNLQFINTIGYFIAIGIKRHETEFLQK